MISRGKRNRGRTKTEDKERKRLLSLQPAPVTAKRRKKRRKSRTSEETTGGVRLKDRNRNKVRNKAVKRAKREHKKQLKEAKKQSRAKSKAKARSTGSRISAPKAQQEPSEIPDEELPREEDVVWSTFEGNVMNGGALNIAKDIVDQVIKSVGKTEAMKRLVYYMEDVKDKYDIYSAVIRTPSEQEQFFWAMQHFMMVLLGRPLSLSEIDALEERLEREVFEEIPVRLQGGHGFKDVTHEEDW